MRALDGPAFGDVAGIAHVDKDALAFGMFRNRVLGVHLGDNGIRIVEIVLSGLHSQHLLFIPIVPSLSPDTSQTNVRQRHSFRRV